AQPQTALDRALAAHRMYRSQHNSWRLARTRLVLVQAKYATGQVAPQLLREANWAVARREILGSGDATQAPLLAGRGALERGGREPRARPGNVTCQRLAGRGATGANRRPIAPAAYRMPPRARGLGRTSLHSRRVGTAGAGHRARRRASYARAAPRGARSPA